MEPSINRDLTHFLKAPYDLTFELLSDVGWTFPDADADGVVDDEDCDSTSDLRATVFVGTANTGVPNTFFSNGCTMADLVVQAQQGGGGHGAFVSAVAHLTNGWVNGALISGRQKGAIQKAAAGSN